MQLEKSVTPAVYYLGFNMDDAVVGAPAGERGRALRQAMSLAIDADEFLRLFTNGRGIAGAVAAPARHLRLRSETTGIRIRQRRSRARARRCCVEAGYPNGIDPATGKPLHLTFDVNDTSARGLLQFQFFVDAWKRSASTSRSPPPTTTSSRTRCAAAPTSSSAGAGSPTTRIPENFLFLLYGADGRTQQRRAEHRQLRRPATTTSSSSRMRALDDGPSALALIAEMRAILERERPWIEVFHPEDYALTTAGCTTSSRSALSLPAMKYYDVDPARAPRCAPRGTARCAGRPGLLLAARRRRRSRRRCATRVRAEERAR